MSKATNEAGSGRPRAGIEMSTDDFRAAGHRLIDALADFYESLPDRRVAPGESVSRIREVLPPRTLPETGRAGAEVLAELAPLLFDHSVHNGHPRFFGYITSSAAPLGALADLLAAGVNQNCGLRDLSPLANEIEMQAVTWLAELIGFPTPCGGLMVTGGNMANILAFMAARYARLPGEIRRNGILQSGGRPRVYGSKETHTWIEKAADIAGIGTDSIRWIATDGSRRLDPEALERAIAADRAAGDLPFLIVGSAGTVSTGAIDPLDRIASIAREHGLWFHVDGAYGAPAAVLPEASDELRALRLADSVALDPHKWLYCPIEAGCTLVREPEALRNAFSFRPAYYRLGDEADAGSVDYYEHGMQNTRAFRALKVWLCLAQAGREGYVQSIREDIRLSRLLARKVEAAAELELGSQHLSIATFRYRPAGAADSAEWHDYVDALNRRLLVALQKGGAVYVSNSVLDGRHFLRACIVNFRTGEADVDALVATVLGAGRELDSRLRPEELVS